MIPIIIIAYNQLTYISNMVIQCLPLTDNIVIIDNASTYEPLIYFYKELSKLKNIKIIRHTENVGSLVYQKYLHLFPDEYIVTDPDLLFNPKMPDDVINILVNLRKKYDAETIGLALDISNHRDFIIEQFNGKSIYEWEITFWQNKVMNEKEELYIAPIATTFALHSKSNQSRLSLRIADRFTCRHIPWYRKEKCPLPVPIEERIAFLQSNIVTHWNKS